MMQQAQQLQAQKEEEQRRKAMEALQQKQNLIRQMANLTVQFQEQKMKLLHGVTYQFLTFCKCSDTSEMLNRFFSESFGVPNGMDDWSMGVKDLGEDGAGFGANSSMGGNSSSSWSASFEISWGNSSGGMGGFNGSVSGGSNNSMPGGPSFNGSFSGGQSFNNSMMGQGGEAATTARPPADVTVTSDQDLQDRMERDQMEAKAKRFYQMDQQQRAKELFSGLVATLCERASEYVESVKSFEQYYIMYAAAMEANHQQQQQQQQQQFP
ncbi:hypothetical protein C0Q70_03755 [Pomacea canaliculata]|uniref:Uncharacterized protein n=2 Tax=Pomacea canaliculata TaxID=400727 RepID=A0A2T7PTL3_POMCA|nr:hypothetical protein C0Q70_03755 [Pomacea canaliculata]